MSSYFELASIGAILAALYALAVGLWRLISHYIELRRGDVMLYNQRLHRTEVALAATEVESHALSEGESVGSVIVEEHYSHTRLASRPKTRARSKMEVVELETLLRSLDESIEVASNRREALLKRLEQLAAKREESGRQ